MLPMIMGRSRCIAAFILYTQPSIAMKRSLAFLRFSPFFCFMGACVGPRTESQPVKLREYQSMIDFAIEGIIMGRAQVRFGEGKSTVSHSGTFGEEADERTTSCRGRIELAWLRIR